MLRLFHLRTSFLFCVGGPRVLSNSDFRVFPSSVFLLNPAQMAQRRFSILVMSNIILYPLLFLCSRWDTARSAQCLRDSLILGIISSSVSFSFSTPPNRTVLRLSNTITNRTRRDRAHPIRLNLFHSIVSTSSLNESANHIVTRDGHRLFLAFCAKLCIWFRCLWQ